MFIKHIPPPLKNNQTNKQINNKPLNAPLSQSQYRETAALADQHTRVFQARALSSVEQERDQVATRGTATLGGEVGRRCGFYGCFKCAHQIT